MGLCELRAHATHQVCTTENGALLFEDGSQKSYGRAELEVMTVGEAVWPRDPSEHRGLRCLHQWDLSHLFPATITEFLRLGAVYSQKSFSHNGWNI